MILFRRHKNFMYHDLKLNVKLTNKFGYHINCLKKVITVKSKYKEEFEEFCKTQNVPNLSSQCYEPSTSVANQQPSASVSDQAISSISVPNEQPSTTSESTTRNKKLTCVFCGHVEKKVSKRRLYVTIPQKEATVTEIKEMAESSQNSSLIKNLEDLPTVAYHSNCFTALKTTLQRQNKKKPEPRYWHANRQLHQSAFAVISDVITMEIIEKNRVMFLCDLFSQYKALLLEFGENKVKAEDFHDYRAESLENKMINSFGDRLIIEPSSAAHRKKIVYQFNIDTSQLAGEIANLEEKQQNRHRHVAYELRNSITSVQNKKLLADLSVDDVILGECTIPEDLFNFVCDLVQGPDIRRKNSNEDLVKIKSLCSDLIYMVSKGRVKPSN
ncbi:uncharacterized protein LOC128856322 [Anastrepha ludens]|uniref:uncharacterized protein LOC128856322 n=1 Tax=Anastrepha ludens TaxID=28586 RepID=UPI0023AE77D3|nr:uncharacterized protein LOC128856322 [Anastrepha ludens]